MTDPQWLSEIRGRVPEARKLRILPLECAWDENLCNPPEEEGAWVVLNQDGKDTIYQRFDDVIHGPDTYEGCERFISASSDIPALLRHVDELREALGPFAKAHAKGRPRYERVGSRHYDEMPGEWRNALTVTMADGRAAEKALQHDPTKEG